MMCTVRTIILIIRTCTGNKYCKTLENGLPVHKYMKVLAIKREILVSLFLIFCSHHLNSRAHPVRKFFVHDVGSDSQICITKVKD